MYTPKHFPVMKCGHNGTILFVLQFCNHTIPSLLYHNVSHLYLAVFEAPYKRFSIESQRAFATFTHKCFSITTKNSELLISIHSEYCLWSKCSIRYMSTIILKPLQTLFCLQPSTISELSPL